MIRPLGKRVLVKPFTDAEKTASGIIIPESAKNPIYFVGEVVAVGSRIELDIVKGMKVAFQKIYDEIKHEDVTYYLVEEVFLIAVYD